MAEIKDLITQDVLDSAIKETVGKLKTYIDSLMPYDFATDSWEKISEVAESGQAEKHYQVGNTRIIKLTTGEEITVRIVGFNHDTKVSGGTAGISIEAENLLSDAYVYDSSSNNWETSSLRTALNGDIYDTLPDDLKAVIKPVYKKTAVYDTQSVESYEEKVWIVSLAEVYSQKAIEDSTYSYIQPYVDLYKQEGEQYEFYKNLIADWDLRTANQDLQKTRSDTGANANWWFRSPRLSTSTGAWCFSYSNAYISSYTVSGAYRVALGFCI